MEDGKTKQTNFRRVFLTKCQQEFEKDKKDNEILTRLKEEIDQAETVRRKMTFFAATKNFGLICSYCLEITLVYYSFTTVTSYCVNWLGL